MITDSNIKITIAFNDPVLDSEELDEAQEWSLAVFKASTIELLSDPEEDIYTLEDGKPIEHEM